MKGWPQVVYSDIHLKSIYLSILIGPVRPDLLREETLADMFRASAGEYPTKEALIFGDMSLSYQQLDHWSDAVAAFLHAQGIGPGQSVGLWWPRSLELIVAVLGIVKSGAAYVPVDREMPAERVHTVMAEVGASACFTDADLDLGCPIYRVPVIPAISDIVTPPAGPMPDDRAYILYTSGSTGKPKGIPITHRQICHLVRSEQTILGVRADDRVYQGFSVSFDMWCEETWVSYLVGATLWVADSVTSKSIDELSTILLENEITVLHAVPSLLAVMEAIDLPKLRIINAGGEACTPQVLNKWAKDGRDFYNSYGPTETTVSATFAKLKKGDPITIGKPLANYGLAVVDENMHPVPIGQSGELIVTGIGVSNGYLNLEALTKEKFLPKNDSLQALPGAMIYRTGDATYMDSDQNIHFVGRIDSQVKLRGFRIELGEIESLLNDQIGILQAAVALKKDANDQEQLTGYVVVSKDFVFDEAYIKEQLALKLPSYMVPLTIVKLDELPRLSSGKIDRKQLPTPSNYFANTSTENNISESDSIETKTIKILKNIFIKDDINLESDFFTDLGGHSLLAASFVSKMRDEGKVTHASLKDVYQSRPLSLLVNKWEAEVKKEAKTKKDFTKVSNKNYYLCWLAQTVSLVLIFGFLASEIFIPYLAYYFTLLEKESHFTAAIVAFLMFSIIPPLFIGLGIAIKWIVIGKFKEGKYPLWGSYYFRWWFVTTFQKIVPTQFLNGTPLYPIYMRLMGVTIEDDAQLSNMTIGAEDLVTIKKDVSISSNVVLDNAIIENGYFILSKIIIGNHAYIGSSSVIEGNTTIEDWGELQDLSLLEHGNTIGRAEVWKGSPSKLVETRSEKDFLEPSQKSLDFS